MIGPGAYLSSNNMIKPTFNKAANKVEIIIEPHPIAVLHKEKTSVHQRSNVGERAYTRQAMKSIVDRYKTKI